MSRIVRKLMAAGLLFIVLLFANGVQAVEVIHGLGGPAAPHDFGTVALERNDDSSSAKMSLLSVFPNGLTYFGRNYKDFWINTNGNITFRGPLGTYTPNEFPISNQPMIAPFWGDVDTRGQTINPHDNQIYYAFVGNKLIVTWDNVGYYSSSTNKRNTFQLILTNRDDRQSGDFDVEFRYERLEWTTGNASGGSNGLGGTPAQVGFDAGDKVNFYKQKDSFTANVLTLTDTSNVEEPGIWRWEVRDGAIFEPDLTKLKDVRVVSTISKEQLEISTPTFTPSPYKQTDLGQYVELEWRYGAVVVGRDKTINFKVQATGLKPGEKRLIVQNTVLSYTDPNGKFFKTELGELYLDVLPALMGVSIQTDKNTYTAGENAQITPTIQNLSRYAATGTVEVSILDQNNTVVSVYNYPNSFTLPVSGVSVLASQVQSTAPPLLSGSYKAVATLTDQAGNKVTARTTFEVETTPVEHSPPIKGKISSNKVFYSSSETVLLQDRIYNQTVNTIYKDLVVVTTLEDAQGQVLWKTQEAMPQFPSGQIKDYLYRVPLNNAEQGIYTAKLQVRDAANQLMASSDTTIEVLSSSITGTGLLGALKATPNVMPPGATATLNAQISNKGNSRFTALPLRLDIISIDQQKRVGSFDLGSVDLMMAEVKPLFPQQWITQGVSGEQLLAVLSATVGNGETAKQLTLAQDTFTLREVKSSCSDPDALRFTPLTQQPYSTPVMSNSVALSGIGSGCTVDLLIENGEYKLERAGRILTQGFASGQAKAQDTKAQGLFSGFTATPMAVQDGDILTLAQKTSAQPATTTTVRITLGKTVSNWAATTRAIHDIPASHPATRAILLILLGLTGLAGLRRRSPRMQQP